MGAKRNFSTAKDTYIRPWCAPTCTQSICIPATKDVHMHLFGISCASNMYQWQHSRTYIYVLHILCQQRMTYIFVVKVHMLQRKEFACSRQAKTVEDIAVQPKWKGKIGTTVTFSLNLASSARQKISDCRGSACYNFFFDETWKSKNMSQYFCGSF